MVNSVSFEAFICLFDLLLEVDALEAFLSEPASLSQQLRTHVKVEDEIWLDQASVRPKTPIKAQSLKLPPKGQNQKDLFNEQITYLGHRVGDSRVSVAITDNISALTEHFSELTIHFPSIH